MKATTQRRVRRFAFEALEDRRMLAGNVTAQIVKGNLVVNGDANDNWVDITAGLNPGEVVVTGLSDNNIIGTRINGGGPNNSVTLGGFKGDIIFDLKAGVDFGFIHAMTFKGLDAKTGQGDDLFAIVDSALTGKAKVETGDGNDSFAILASTFNKLDVDLGKGADSFSMDNSTVNGNAEFDGGDDSDRLSFAGNSGNTFNAALDVDLGRGDDSLIFGLSFFPQQVVRGEAEFTGGDGNDNLTFSNAVFNGLATKLGAGDDIFRCGEGVAPLTVNGNAEFDGGDGIDNVTFIGAAFQRSLKVDTGKGNDVGIFQNSNVAGKAEFDGGDGNDNFSSTNAVFNIVAVDMGKGNDTLTSTTTTITNTVKSLLNGGPGTDTLADGGGNTLGVRNKNFEILI